MLSGLLTQGTKKQSDFLKSHAWWKTTQMSVSGWVDKEDVVSLCNGRLLGNKKEWSTNACYTVNEP